METIKSINIPNLGINFEKMGDFLYHEGPLLSLYKDQNPSDNYYFYKWTDCDATCNRWLVFLVKKENLRRFLFKELSLKDLVNINSFVFMVDIDNDLNPKQYLVAAVSDIPKAYLPKDTSFYKEGKYTELAESIKTNMVTENNSIVDFLHVLAEDIKGLKSEQNRVANLMTRLVNQTQIQPV